jgi:hypothetical protein
MTATLDSPFSPDPDPETVLKTTGAATDAITTAAAIMTTYAATVVVRLPSADIHIKRRADE